MSRFKKVLKWSVLSILSLVTLVVLFGVWFINLLPEPTISKEAIEQSRPSDLPYLTENVVSNRGKILAVVTSTDHMGSSGKSTGFEQTELARAYYVFQANGFEVDIASPLGGTPPVVLDKGDMKEFDFAFQNDSVAQRKVENSYKVEDVNPDLYDAIYFVGGKGAMFDFPKNEAISSIIRQYYETGKVVAAVCHGPAAFVGVSLSNGQPLLAGKRVCGFTNEEELLLIPDALEVFPFLLQDQLSAVGAQFEKGEMYLNNVVVDGNIVTGQNPWSVWTLSESVITQLGYAPKYRVRSAEENSIEILKTYTGQGKEAAKSTIKEYATAQIKIDRELLLVHSLLSIYQMELSPFIDLIQLVRYANQMIN